MKKATTYEMAPGLTMLSARSVTSTLLQGRRQKASTEEAAATRAATLKREEESMFNAMEGREDVDRLASRAEGEKGRRYLEMRVR